MNITILIQQHETAIEKLQDIARLEKMRDSLLESANGFGGANFPDKKEEWEKAAARYQQRIYDKMVDYRIFTRNLK